MEPYIPRVILIQSNTSWRDIFVTGFISLNTTDNGITVVAEGYDEKTNTLLYTQEEIGGETAYLQVLPFFNFPNNSFPKELNISFNAGKMSGGPIKTTSGMAHPDDGALAQMFVPRPFIIQDLDQNKKGSGDFCYGFLMDVFTGNELFQDGMGKDPIISVSKGTANGKDWNTTMWMYQFGEVPSESYLNLTGVDYTNRSFNYSNVKNPYGTYDGEAPIIYH